MGSYFEKTVVASRAEFWSLFYVVVEGPEVLYCVECDDGALVVAPAAVAVVSEEPQGPRVL